MDTKLQLSIDLLEAFTILNKEIFTCTVQNCFSIHLYKTLERTNLAVALDLSPNSCRCTIFLIM